MERVKTLLLLASLAVNFGIVKACQVEGVSNWWLDLSVVDTDRGVFFQGATSDIAGILSAEHSGEGLNSGPYFVATHDNSTFVLSLHENFERYEEDETSLSMSISVTFSCSNGNTINTVFIISVIDTNNNDPVYLAGDEITFTITPPLPPGYLVTGCAGGIDVRDIDLTTQRIEFEIEDNDYFEIAYDAASSTEAKNFAAVLRTTTFIRSLQEPVSLRISATDVDQTGDPPRTTYATLRIESDGEFELPEEPIFSQVFYMATYSAEHAVSLEQPVYLTQGFDDDVNFNMTGDYASNFQLVREGNQLSIAVTSPLALDVITLSSLLLAVTATREYTSGASATIVLQLPEAVRLEFEENYYEGTIIDNALSLLPITITQGYDNGYEVTISSPYESFFEASQENNIITLTMQPLDTDIIEENTFVTLQLAAISNTSSATALILLEIIKNDTVTPLFQERIYTGTYDADTGLDIGAITLYQGYDETVSFYMQGDYENYFTLSQNANVLTLQMASNLPQQVLEEESQILLTIGALKPQTVGAHATVSIALPSARELRFEAASYTGLVEDNIINLDPIELTSGYESDVVFTLIGDHADFFTLSTAQNVVTINLSTPLTEIVIQENNFLLLSLEATGLNTRNALATVVLDIVKQDTTTPVFERRVYNGEYRETNTVEFENIFLVQGYDDTVTFRLEGDHSEYFAVSNVENNVVLTLQSDVPAEIVYDRKVLVFHIIAEKPLTVGANAAVTITFPQALTELAVMRFSQTNYIGALENDTLTLEIVTLEIGYTVDTIFRLTGEFAAFFTVSNSGAQVSVSLNSDVPADFQSRRLIPLEIEAERERAVSAYATIIIELSQEALTGPLFAEAYYRGFYTEANGLQFEQTIYLQQGLDETVTFDLEGDLAEWFSLAESGEGVTLTLTSAIPQVVVETNRQLLFAVVANKPGTTAARTAVSIDLPDEASGALLRFGQASYVGRIENGSLQVPPFILLGEYLDNLTFTISGDYSPYFTLNQEGNAVTLELANDLSTEDLTADPFLVLDLRVSRVGSSDGFTAIVLEIVAPDQLTPVFGSAFYTGSYSDESGLTFENTMLLLQGYDDTVEFSIEGDDSQGFAITQNGNSLVLSIIDGGPPQVVGRSHLVFAVVASKPRTLPGTAAIVVSITDDSQGFAITQNGNSLVLSIIDGGPPQVVGRSHLVFAVVASKPRTLPGTAAIVVSITDALTPQPLRFSNPYYTGSIVNGSLSLDGINLAEGYAADINFTLTGDLAGFFEVTNEGSAVSLQLSSELPTDVVGNVLFVLEARSSTTAAFATIILEAGRSIDVELSVPLFEEPYYLGSYSDIDGLSFDQPIRLIDGFDPAVVFSLEGEQSVWFVLQQNDEILSIQLASTIPSDILESNINLIFSVLARRGNVEGRSAIVISITGDSPSPTIIRFDQSYYMGQLQNTTINLDPIALAEGFSENTTFTLRGGLAGYFQATNQAGSITVELMLPIPEAILEVTRVIVLELEASAPQAISAYTAIILDNSGDDILTPLVFTEPYYTGTYSEQGLVFDSPIALSNGNNGAVTYALEGDQAEWFSLEQVGNIATVCIPNGIPSEVLLNNHNLIFTVTASQPGRSAATAAIIISLTDAGATAVLRFDEIHYRGSIADNELVLDAITLSTGYSEDVAFALYGDLSSSFDLNVEGPIVALVLSTPIQQDVFNNERIIILELEASRPNTSTIPAHSTIILEITSENEDANSVVLTFSEAYYTGSYTEDGGLNFGAIMSLSDGYEENVTFSLNGDNAEYFALTQEGNSVTLTLTSLLPIELLANNQFLIFTITAETPDSNNLPARSTIVISLTYDPSSISILRFERASYQGTIESNILTIPDTIELTQGFNENLEFTLQGELVEHFELSSVGSTVSITLIQPLTTETVPANRIIVLEVLASGPQAITAYTTLVFEVVVVDDTITVPVFSETYYVGSYSFDDGLSFESDIFLSQGFDETVVFELEGDNAQWFVIEQNGNGILLATSDDLPVPLPYSQFLFTVVATKPGTMSARAGIFILIETDTSLNPQASFESALYSGIIQGGEVSHETINVAGYNGTEIQILGDSADSFEATLAEGTVTIQAASTLLLPEDLTYVALELRAGSASTALILDVYDTGVPTPVVTFSAASYEIRTDISHTGLVGIVLATADNGERITYTLQLDDDHLAERLAVSESGELHLSAPANSGVYAFTVEATTVTTQASASAPVQLIVDAISTCGADQDLVVPPLIVLDRDEEEAYTDLILSNATGCRFQLTNRWPVDQDWLYVDEIGLHARAIDREDPSIAFMPLSQVQVELILECDSDNASMSRTKRSIEASLGPYDYGDNKWLIADTILYNSRRSFVNLIVNDINDNYPIFEGKENEPIAVGYPIPELLDVVPPRALVELKATDADVGENAALVYWSSEPELAVSPTTGSVHVRDNQRELEEDRLLTVHATDRNGEGLTGDIQVLVRLLDVEHISVLTIRNAFLEEEQSILNNLTQAIGYEVRALTSIVVSDEYENLFTRNKRQAVQTNGASLRIYVYGLRNTVPVDVNELTSDINSNVIASVVIADTVSLQDYLESREIRVLAGRDIGLLAATIVLSVLLFILIVSFVLWFYLKWRKDRKYQEFSDENSLASQKDSVNVVNSKPDTVAMPRLNIDDLKRSERRLQELLDAPVHDVVIEAGSSKTGLPAPPTLEVLPDMNVPIVIQSIDKLKAADEDDEDEFGERKNNTRRKSVVTFNENVEKIIHVEDRPDSDSDPEYEIEKL